MVFIWQIMSGDIVARDYNESVKWLRKSSEKGNIKGQFALGNMYEKGYGVLKDMNKAIELYRIASHKGLNEAKERLKQLNYSE